MRVSRILAVDCGASHVSCGRFSSVAGRLVLDHAASRQLPASDLNDPAWVAAVAAALQDLIRAESLRGECVLGLPGHLTHHRLLRIPRVTARQRQRIIEFDQRQGMPAPAGEMIWSQASVAEFDGGQEWVLAAAKRHLIEDLAAQVRALGLFPCAVPPGWSVLRRAIASRPPAAGDALVLAIGARSSQLMLCGPGRFFACTIAIGGNLVTQKLVEELQLDFLTAESLKLRGFAAETPSVDGRRERQAAQTALDQFVRRLSAEIQCCPPLALAEGDPGRPPVLFLTGGGARLRDLPAALSARLHLRVERWDLRCQAGSNPPLATPEGTLDGDRLADLIGLAACAPAGRWKGEDLLPRQFHGARFHRRRWLWLAAAVLIGVAGAVYPVWRWRLRTGEVQRQIVEADAQIASLQRFESHNRANLTRLAEVRSRTAELRRLAVARSAWIALLGDLQARLAMVQDAWIDRLQILPADPPPTSGESSARTARRGPVSPEKAAGIAGAVDGVRIRIVGNVFDAASLPDHPAEGDDQRATALLTALRSSPLISAVEREHFDHGQPGLLRFELTLRLMPHALD